MPMVEAPNAPRFKPLLMQTVARRVLTEWLSRQAAGSRLPHRVQVRHVDLQAAVSGVLRIAGDQLLDVAGRREVERVGLVFVDQFEVSVVHRQPAEAQDVAAKVKAARDANRKTVLLLVDRQGDLRFVALGVS